MGTLSRLLLPTMALLAVEGGGPYPTMDFLHHMNACKCTYTPDPPVVTCSWKSIRDLWRFFTQLDPELAP